MEDSSHLIIGRKPLLDAITEGVPIASIWMDTALKGSIEIEIRNAANQHHIPIKRVHKTILNKKSKSNHQGIIAYTSPVRFQDLDTLIAHLYEQGEIPFFVYLDRIQDVGNLGSIIRSAETLGVHALLIPTKKMAPINDQVVKISAGAIHHLPICRLASVQDTIATLHNHGIQIITSALEENSKPIQAVDLTVPLCIVIGSEDTGASPVFLSTSDQLVNIPQYGKTESLNAAIATGICLYEVQRQRQL